MSLKNFIKVYPGIKDPKIISKCIRFLNKSFNDKKFISGGLFNNGDPNIEILEEIEYTKGEDWILRKAEQKWASLNRDNCINRRRCYVSPSVKKKERDQRIKKYHDSEKGKLALRKASINHKLKQTAKPVTGLKRAELKKELEKINIRQAELRIEKLSSSCEAFDEEPPVFPPDLHPDQSDETSSNKE